MGGALTCLAIYWTILAVGRTSEPDLCEESPRIGLLPKLNTDLRPCVMAWKELYF